MGTSFRLKVIARAANARAPLRVPNGEAALDDTEARREHCRRRIEIREWEPCRVALNDGRKKDEFIKWNRVKKSGRIGDVNEAEGGCAAFRSPYPAKFQKSTRIPRSDFSPSRRSRGTRGRGAGWHRNSGGIREEIRARDLCSLVCLETVRAGRP